MIDKHTIYTLKKIEFIERYKNIATKYQFNVSESFEDYESNQVVKIISELGYESSFNKKEKSFKITETIISFNLLFL